MHHRHRKSKFDVDEQDYDEDDYDDDDEKVGQTVFDDDEDEEDDPNTSNVD